MSIKNLSVFFPLFNEEGNVKEDVEKAVQVLEKLKLNYEILLINDGSSDRTGEIADNIAAGNTKVRVIHHKTNLGYGEALKSGFYNAEYDVIVYTDGDGQFDFSEVTKFLEKIEDHDLVLGYRIKRQDPFFRILFKKGWKFSLLMFFGLTFKDVDCGFKIVKREVLEKIPRLESTRGAMINAELSIKAKKAGFKIAQVGVNHYPRLSGKATGASLNVILRSYFDLLRLWWKLKDQKILFLTLIFVLLLAVFLRFYKLSEYMTFLGDEGRDAIVIKNMLLDHHLPLIGPPTSVGNIYLGPLYYYMMAVPMAIFWLNPVAAAGMNAAIGVAIVVLIYYLGKIWFGRIGGLISSYLYAISPVTITYSRSSWNPNPTPLFALIGIFGLYRMHKSGNFLWLILTGVSFAASLQMHYLSLILIPIGGLLWLYEIFYKFYRKQQIKNLVSGTILGIFTFLLVMSPLFWFDLRHNFLNYRAITQLLTQSSTVYINPLSNALKVPTLLVRNLISRYITSDDESFTAVMALFITIIIVREIIRWFRNRSINWPIFTIFIWLFVGLLGLSFYQQDIYDHYLGFLNPTIFLLVGYASTADVPKTGFKKWGSVGFVAALIIILTILNLEKIPLNHPPNKQLKRTQEVAKFIINESSGKDFNFALLAQRNYDPAYQFYLDIYGHKPKQVPFDITDQLFVVCEDPICEPINNPKYEIAGFGWAKIVSDQKVFGVRVLKLVHNPSGKP